MTPQQALSLLDQVVSKVNMDRASHAQVQQAVKVLSEKINPQPAPKPVEVVAPVSDGK